MKFDPIRWTSKIQPKFLRNRTLDLFLQFGVPFNRWLGLHVQDISPEKVILKSPEKKLRENHLGAAHACAIGLVGEVPAGLLVVQQYPFDKYRFILTELKLKYHKQGRGTLFGECKAPPQWPRLENGEARFDLFTEITNTYGELVATAVSSWQVKDWELVGNKAQIEA